MFPFHDKEQFECKSYLLDKDFKICLEENYFEYFSNTVGVFIEQAREMGLIGGSEGLGYKLENVVVANSINAHRFSHYAKEHGRQNALEEIIFQAHL